MPDLTLLVLAAGMGSRYGGLKQIDPFGPAGEAILDYSVYDASRAGFNKVVFVIRKDIEDAFHAGIGARYYGHISVEYVFQEIEALPDGYIVPPGRTKPWGTTHALLAASNTIHEPFAVINADDFYGLESYRVLAVHLASATPESAMVGFPLRNTLSEFGPVSRGLCRIDDAGFLKEIVELKEIERNGEDAISTEAGGAQTQLPGGSIVSMNMWGFTPDIFGQLRSRFLAFLAQHGKDLKAECYLPTAMNELIHAGEAEVKVLQSNGTWFGVTYREDRPRAIETLHGLIESGYYPSRLWA
ncbi:MAG: sugar phosphate nucleotidyltransferase [Terracidiphilus sp.]